MATSAERMRRKRLRDKASGLVEVKVWVPASGIQQIRDLADVMKHEHLAQLARERLAAPAARSRGDGATRASRHAKTNSSGRKAAVTTGQPVTTDALYDKIALERRRSASRPA